MTVGRLRFDALLGMAAAACAATSRPPDADGDGVPDYDDCAPNDARRFVGNAEVCDGEDNDCDRRIDEDLIQRWFVDVDGDGHGNPDRHLDTCAPDPTMVAVGDDCDDVQADVFPGAVERCDDKDNDCANGVDDVRWMTGFEPGWNEALVARTGDATVVTDPADGNAFLRLVRGQAELQGGLWILPRVPGDRWRVRFRMRMSGVGVDPGEGFAFAFVQTDAGPVTGSGGAGLGLYGADVEGWALEFDVASQGPQDPVSEAGHLAFQHIRDGALVLARPDPPRFDQEGWHNVQYMQDGATFEVQIDDVRAWNGTVAFDAGAWVTMGFTAATSPRRQMQFGIDDVEVACPDTPEGPPAIDSGGP